MAKRRKHAEPTRRASAGTRKVSTAKSDRRALRRFDGIDLTDAEINRILDGICPRIAKYPEMAAALGFPEDTLRKWVYKGEFTNAIRRGSRARILRNRFVKEFFKTGGARR